MPYKEKKLQEKNEELRAALIRTAIRWQESPNGRWSGYVCELCGCAGDNDKLYGIDIIHTKECILAEQDDG